MLNAAPQPRNEKARLENLRSYRILDTGIDARFERVTRIAAAHLETPMSLISLVDEARQWFKSRVGLNENETSRGVSFCAHAIMTPQLMIVEDALLDERFADNPLVTASPYIRFYAGAPLITKEGFAIGTLCVLDRKPRQLGAASRQILVDLAAITIDELELFQHIRDLNETNRALQSVRDHLSKRNRALKISASTDSLTALANRGAFSEMLTNEWRRAIRTQRPLSLLMIDVDHFKRFNDRFGHIEGDRCLKTVAEAISSSIRRPGDFAARYGGEEFAVILPETVGAGALAIAEAIRKKVAGLKLESPAAPLGFVTVSAGVASTEPQRGTKMASLLAEADRLLYQAKEAGRNRVCATNSSSEE